jgi:hypothetical protein
VTIAVRTATQTSDDEAAPRELLREPVKDQGGEQHRRPAAPQLEGHAEDLGPRDQRDEVRAPDESRHNCRSCARAREAKTLRHRRPVDSERELPDGEDGRRRRQRRRCRDNRRRRRHNEVEQEPGGQERSGERAHPKQGTALERGPTRITVAVTMAPRIYWGRPAVIGAGPRFATLISSGIRRRRSAQWWALRSRRARSRAPHPRVRRPRASRRCGACGSRPSWC